MNTISIAVEQSIEELNEIRFERFVKITLIEDLEYHAEEFGLSFSSKVFPLKM